MSDRPQRTNTYTADPVSDRYRECLFELLAVHAPLWNQLTYRRRQQYFAAEVVKHVGDVDGFGPWWESVLGQLELVADDLYGFIDDAQDITVDFTDVPFDLAKFYTLLAFPEYLAQHAADDARSNAADPFEIDMWMLHSGATYALTHFFRGKEGDALDGYVRTANDILFNPDGTLERVEQAYERQAEEETDADGQTGLESQVALAQIEQVSEGVREKAETFEEREELLRERFADAAD